MRQIKPSARRTKARSVTFDCGCTYHINRHNQVTSINTEGCSERSRNCINEEVGQKLMEEAESS